MLIYRGHPASIYTCYLWINFFIQQQFSSLLVGTFGTLERFTPSISTFQTISQTGLTSVSSFISYTLSLDGGPATPQIDAVDVASRDWVLPVPVQAKRQKTGIFSSVFNDLTISRPGSCT